jgi:hypothetical protein
MRNVDMKSVFPGMSGRQIAILLLETSVMITGLIAILIVGIPMIWGLP